MSQRKNFTQINMINIYATIVCKFIFRNASEFFV